MRRKPKAADFPPEFLDGWMLACEGKLLLSFESAGLARNFIQRMYMFRRAMAEENAALASPWFLVDLRIHDEQGNVVQGRKTQVPGKAIVKPASLAWKEQIRSQIAHSSSGSGVGGPGVGGPQPPVIPPAQSEEPTFDRVTETLSDLGYGTGEG